MNTVHTKAMERSDIPMPHRDSLQPAIAAIGRCPTCRYLTVPGCADLPRRNNRPEEGCPAWFDAKKGGEDLLPRSEMTPEVAARWAAHDARTAALSRDAATADGDVSVLSADQAARVDRAKSYYAGMKTTAGKMGVYGFLFGLELRALKASTAGDHGQWMKFTAAHFPGILHRSITWFMDASAKLEAASNLNSKGHATLPTVGNIQLLADGSLPKPVEEKVQAAWHEFAEGKTVTQFLRNIGAIREKQPQEHHNPKPRTTDEELEDRKKAVFQVHKDLRADVNLMIGKITATDGEGDMITLTETSEWKETLRTLRRLTKLIVPLTKRKLTVAEKKQQIKAIQKAEGNR